MSEQDGRAWAAEMFKRLWQAGANMEFHPIGRGSDIGPSYNYQVNVSNAFVTASRLAPYVNSIPGRRVVIAHSLGTMVATAAPGRAAGVGRQRRPSRSLRRSPAACPRFRRRVLSRPVEMHSSYRRNDIIHRKCARARRL